MSYYEIGYKAGRDGYVFDVENEIVNEWFAAGWYDGKADKVYLETGVDISVQRV